MTETMTTRFSTFIGRTEELALIDQLVRENGGSQALFIIGPGGIGKTSLLQQVSQVYANDPSVMLSPNIDFDETSHRLELNIFNSIADANRAAFSAYIEQYEDYRKILGSGVSQSRIVEEELRTKDAFVACYNENVRNRRGILSFDTIEIMSQAGIWTGLVKSLSRLDNSVVILAGRRYGRAKDLFEQFFDPSDIHMVMLKPFSKDDSVEYLSRLVSNLDANIMDKLFILTNGRPILLALAIEWLQREKPFPEILERTVEELRALDGDARTILAQKFEEALVSQLLEPRKLIDNVVIQMAYVHRRFDADVLAFALGLTEEKSRAVVAELQAFPFVKIRPYGIALHDEMRALINTHIWPKIDPMGLERRKLAESMVQFYDQSIPEVEASGDDIAWLYMVEQLYYQLQCDLSAGHAKFLRYFDEASRAYQLGARDLLLNEIKTVQDRYAPELKYEIDVREAQALLGEVKLDEAADKLQQMAAVYVTDEQRAEILVLLGNVEIRLGKTFEAIESVEEALEIAQSAQLESWMGKAELALGWFHRLRGDWSKAFKYYESSLEHTISSGDRMTLGRIFNNLAYITEFAGDHISALGYSDQAIEFFKEMGASRELAMCYSTRGEIYVYEGNYQKGLDYYQIAFETFQRQNDLEFLAIVCSQIGRTLLALNRLEEAQQYAARGVELCRMYALQDLAIALHRLGRVYEGLEDRHRAIKCYEEGREVGERLANSRYVMEHTVYLADVYYNMWREAEESAEEQRYLDLIEQNIAIFEREAAKGIYVYPQDYLQGRIKITRGNMKYDLQEYDEAIDIYRLAYYHIIIGSSDTYTAHELKKFSDRINRLPGEIALHWVRVLESFWEEKGILSAKPQAANFCKKHKIAALLQSQSQSQSKKDTSAKPPRLH